MPFIHRHGSQESSSPVHASGAWRALAEISGRTAEELYDPLCFIENSGTDTQVRSSCRSH